MWWNIWHYLNLSMYYKAPGYLQATSSHHKSRNPENSLQFAILTGGQMCIVKMLKYRALLICAIVLSVIYVFWVNDSCHPDASDNEFKPVKPRYVRDLPLPHLVPSLQAEKSTSCNCNYSNHNTNKYFDHNPILCLITAIISWIQ